MRSDDPSADETLPAPGVTQTTRDDSAPPRIDLSNLPSGRERYVLGEMIGRGGMGDVVLATDAQIGRDVAVKRLRDPHTSSIPRFLREARIQARLDHPAIVPVHEVCVDSEGRPYFVMKRLAGRTLFDLLGPHHPTSSEWTRPRLLRAFVDVCLAIEFAHTRGVVHRDLKPSNIMLGDFGEVYVLDWGVARVLADDASDSLESSAKATEPGATEVGSVLGTIGYMPPEQLRGLPVDRRADVYALGCILFEILTGTALHAPGVLNAALEDYDAHPIRRAPERDIPPELDVLVAQATDRDPMRRPATARELADRVQQFLDGDRDVALRRQLARQQLDLARETLPTADRPDEARSRTAMQHAARALALDPTAREAAELVGRVLLEPPREVPVEVTRELDALDAHDLRLQARIAGVAFLLYGVFVPILYAMGLRDLRYLGALAVIGAINLFITYRLTSLRPVSPWWLRGTIVGNFGALAVLSVIMSPLLVTPTLAVGVMLGFGLHPRFGRVSVLTLLILASVLAGWLAHRLGITPASVATVDGGILVRSPAGAFDLPIMEAAHALFTVCVLYTVGTYARAMWRSARIAHQAVRVQAYRLRQLMQVERA